MNEKLLKLKQMLKKKKPEARRIEKYKSARMHDLSWRKPKGHHSKVRRGMKWELRMPKIGRKTPIILQNLDRFGRELIKIRTAEDLKKLSEKSVGVVASKLGLKSKMIIAEKALGKGYKFLNFNPERIIKKVKEMLSSKKAKPKIEAKEKAETKQAEKPEKPIAKPEKPKKEEAKAEKPKSKNKEAAKAVKPKKEAKGE